MKFRHSILGDMKTKGEEASVRKVAGGRICWKRATVQVAGNENCSLRPCAKSFLSSVYAPRKAAWPQEVGDIQEARQAGSPVLPRGFASSAFLFSSSVAFYTVLLPFSKVNSGSQLLQKSKSHLQNQ